MSIGQEFELFDEDFYENKYDEVLGRNVDYSTEEDEQLEEE